jgi:putative transposase
VGLVGVKRSCELFGRARATFYRQRHPTPIRQNVPRPAPANKLSDPEREAVLALVNEPAHADLAVDQVYVRALDGGTYLCSRATMHRVVRAAGQSGDRRAQRTHPANKKPELVASAPNECWSWDITKLRGPAKGIFFQLYVILDIYSRYVTNWVAALHEDAQLATEFIEDAVVTQGVSREQLTIHADRGGAMRSKPVSQLMIDLGVTRSHSRPHVSNDNPFSESQFKTMKYCPSFPERFGSIEGVRAFCERFFNYYNHEHRHSGIGFHTPASVHYGTHLEVRQQRQITLDDAFVRHPIRFRRIAPSAPKIPEMVWINPPELEVLGVT